MQGKKYEADRRETPMEQKIGDKKKISVNLDAPEEILNHENEKEALFLIFLLMVILYCDHYVRVLYYIGSSFIE